MIYVYSCVVVYMNAMHIYANNLSHIICNLLLNLCSIQFGLMHFISVLWTVIENIVVLSCLSIICHLCFVCVICESVFVSPMEFISPTF